MSRKDRKAQRYKEAVEKNITNAIRNNLDKYKNKTLSVAKMMLGVKREDDQYDSQVMKVTGKETKEVKK
jgi:hypothetical protein